MRRTKFVEVSRRLTILDLARTMACLDCTQMIADINDPLELCQSVISYLRKTLLYERTSVVLVQKSTDIPLVFAHSSDGYVTESQHLEVARVNRIIRPPAKGVIYSVLQSGRERLVQDIDKCPDYLHVADNIMAEACFPIIDRQRCIGVMNVEHSVRDGFSHDDLIMLKIVSVGLSPALRRAHRSGARGLTDKFPSESDIRITA